MAFGDLPLDAPEKANKGQEGGACNRRSCQAEPANWYNHGSHSWYCDDCARQIGRDPVNARDWPHQFARWFPGKPLHPMFETREMMTRREHGTPAAVLPRDVVDRLEKRIRSLHENSVFGKLETVTANVEQNPDGPSLTLDKLQALMGRMAEIPPPPFFGSSTFFPADKALRFTDKRREYVGAHPDFWQKVPAAAAEQTMRLGEIVVYDLDAHEGRRGEFFEAMARAMGGKGA